MKATYERADEIKKTTFSTVGRIGDRFQCNIKDIGLCKKYDLIYGHWSLGYL